MLPGPEAMGEDWLERWAHGRTGWHEAGGNTGLRDHWHVDSGRVLVPLCGKTPDLVWLAERGQAVVGVELAEIAVREFFAEQGLKFTVASGPELDCYRCTTLPMEIWCGDYFQFEADPFDAVYDRGALVAITPAMRAAYVAKTRQLMLPGARQLLITLEYDQAVVDGPPFSLLPDELQRYFSGLERVEEKDDIDNCPPKFRAAGLTDIKEVIWRSSR